MAGHTTAYRRVLEDLAESRGLAGAEELAEKAAAVAPGLTAEEVLENPPGGYGNALDAVLSLSEEEKALISSAFVETFMRPSRLRRDR